MAESSTSSQQLHDVMESDCPICQETFQNPKVLPCLHTFCFNCLETWIEKKPSNLKTQLACPVCRSDFQVPTGGLQELPGNSFVQKMVDMKKLAAQTGCTDKTCDICCDEESESSDHAVATNYCVECVQNMCDRCSKHHGKQKFSKNHNVAKLGSEPTSFAVGATYCPQHQDEALKLYCINCQVPSCVVCFVEVHKMHDCCDIDKKAKEFQQQMSDDLTAVDKRVASDREEEEKLGKESDDLEKRILQTEIEVSAKAQQLKAEIDRDAQKLVEELRGQKDARIQDIETMKKELERQRMIMTSFKQYSSGVIEKGTPYDVSCSAAMLHARASKLLEAPAMKRAQLGEMSVRFTMTPTSQNNLVGTIESKVDIKNFHVDTIPKGKEVRGINVIGSELFVIRKMTPEVEVYDMVTLVLQRRLPVAQLHGACHMASSTNLKRLYITEWNTASVHQLPIDGSPGAMWSTIDKPDGISVSTDDNVVVTCREVGKVKIYKPDGTLVNDITIQKNILHPRLAIAVAGDEFLVCHGYGDPNHAAYGICKMGRDGNVVKAAVVPQAGLKTYSPTSLVVDKQGNVLVADFFNNRVMSLSPSLDTVTELLPVAAGIKKPFRLALVETYSRRLYVGEYSDNASIHVLYV